MRKQTQEEFEERVRKVWGDEFIVVSKYNKPHEKMKFQHKCGWIFDSDPYNVLTGHCVCPVCDPQSKSIDTPAFQQRVWNKSGQDYIVTGEYINMTTPISMRHNNCLCDKGYFDFNIIPRDFLEENGICPYERHRVTQLTIPQLQERLSSFHPGYKILSKEYIDSRDKLDIQCDKGHFYNVMSDGITAGHGCPICSNKLLLVGYNDYNTTHPECSKYLLNYDDGFKFMYGTKEKQYYKCPDCNHIHYKCPSDAFSDSGRFICECNDGVSYPEKYIICLLKQLNINYIHQLSNRYFDWCKNYRYDFYLPDYKIIIEAHGLQHYTNSQWNTLEQIEANDNKKLLTAQKHINSYIVLDCRYSKSEYIKSNILESELSIIFDLSKINWDECNIFANKSKDIEVINLWNSGIKSATEISKIVKLSNTTILKYLDDAASDGLVDFNREQYRLTINHGADRVSVKCLETQTIYESFAEVKKKLGVRLSKSQIIKNNYIGGYHWEMISA